MPKYTKKVPMVSLDSPKYKKSADGDIMSMSIGADDIMSMMSMGILYSPKYKKVLMISLAS